MSSPDNNISIIEINNRTTVVEYLQRLGSSLYDQSINSPEELRMLAEKYTNNGTVLVLTEHDCLKGLCAYYCNDEDGRTAFISMIVVKKGDQSRGYGRKLLHEVIDGCISSGMQVLRLRVNNQNMRAIDFYIRQGFVLESSDGITSVYRLALDSSD